MFISLRWKAVLLSSVVLVLISAVWIGQSIYGALASYDVEVQKKHQSRQQFLNQMVQDDLLKFIQFAQLIVQRSEIKALYEQPIEFSMPQFLVSMLPSWNKSIGLDYIAILAVDGSSLGEAYNKKLGFDIAPLKAVLSGFNTSDSQPFMYCQKACLQLSSKPFVFSNGAAGVIILGRSMADVASRYHNALSSDLAVLIQSSDLLENHRYGLPEWAHSMWVSSSTESIHAMLSAYSLEHSIENFQRSSSFSYENSEYSFNRINIPLLNRVGMSSVFIDISNETESKNKLIESVWRKVWFGVLGLVLSELILILLILGPIRRLINVAKALSLLPKHRYQEAVDTIAKHKTYVNDELTQLEDNTIFVSNEFESLYGKIQETNANLNKKVHSLSRSRAFLTRLLDNPSVFVLTQTKDFEVVLSNSKFKNGIKHSDNNFLHLFSNMRTKDAFIKEAQGLTLNTGKAYQHEVVMESCEGKTLLVSWSHTLVEDEQGDEIIVSVGMDNTEHKKDEVKLKWLANNDSLTKIGNRRSFMRDLNDLLDNHTQGAVLIIDVNKFKQINDIYGHMTGDEVLIDIARALKEVAQSMGSISRLSGDEFTVVLPAVSVGELGGFLTILSSALHGKVTLKNKTVVEYSVSIGAALFPDDGDSYQTLLAHADMAMYKAKKAGLSQWHIFNESDDNSEGLKRDYYLSELIKSALANNLFQLVFQPILSIEKGSVQHYETLLRLNDELGNGVSPAEFIPVSERLGLIRDIDNWVLDNALVRLSEELEFQPDLKISINVSAPTLQMNEYPMIFMDAIKKHNVDAKHIIIELTETAYIENFKQVLDNLTILTDEGATIALDDFGVGFSSFSYLKQLPLRYVKLDGSYIKDLRNHPDNQVFVKSISDMVTAFGMRAIAEFVEDKATLDMLKELGVYYAQGYYIGRPDSELLSNDFHL